MKRTSLHICHPWSGDCAMRGVRLNIWLRGHFFGVSLLPQSRYVDVNGRLRWTTRRRKRLPSRRDV